MEDRGKEQHPTGDWDHNDDEGEGINISLAPKRSFSIIFRGARTLDLMMDDKEVDRDQILNALDSVVRAYKAARVKVANDVLLLRYIWLDLDKVSVPILHDTWKRIVSQSSLVVYLRERNNQLLSF